MARLAPGVDTGAFRPGAGGAAISERLGRRAARSSCAYPRLVTRKGQDTLIRAWPLVRAAGDPVLLLVGGGPADERLRRLARELGVTDSVVFAGPVPSGDLPAYYDAGDVFAMPCRTRRRGLDVEGLGIVYLEASATGLPAGRGRLRRRAGRHPRRRDRVRRARRRRRPPSRPGSPNCSPTPPGPGPWGRRAWPGWTANGGGTWWRGGWSRSWPAELLHDQTGRGQSGRISQAGLVRPWLVGPGSAAPGQS